MSNCNCMGKKLAGAQAESFWLVNRQVILVIFQITELTLCPFSLQVPCICTGGRCKGMARAWPCLRRVTHSCYTDISQLPSLLSPHEAQMRALRMKLYQFLRPWDLPRQYPLRRKKKMLWKIHKEKSHMEGNYWNTMSILEILFQPTHLYNLKVPHSLVRYTRLWRHKRQQFFW